ncbi:RNA polymerase sigma factor [Stieleria marina]|uniref:ECF RNA polymerase sigma factor SigE n=1 Tax=Stieleria marina TaxID=1930275 RepID=A0A517NWN8_9BACT|nr:ECF RNA polymerase sigma factor SigE [Planctomycetes bacterium K23_9]
MNWLEELYRLHRESLFRLAWLILRDQGLAEDALQAAFLKLSRIALPPNNSLSYARQTVRHCAIDLRRTRNVQRTEPLQHDPEQPRLPNDNLDIEALLLALTDPQREVVEFRLRLGMSFKEIASLLNEPLSTVSSRYQRAIDSIKQNLAAVGATTIDEARDG